MIDLASAIRDWQLLLGPAAVLIGNAAQQAYGQDTGASERVIPAALRIADAEALPEVMRIASRHRAAVYPISTGRNWGYGTGLPARDGCVIIDLSALQRVIHFDAEFGVVTLEPGVTQGMLGEFLESGGHPYMVPVTGAGPTCSVLANALERGYGVTPIVDHFSAVTDIEAVLADGSLYRTALREVGGEELARLFKWGIGPYSAGLFAQSGFGIVTRVSIVLARRPECVKVCLFGLRSDELLESVVEGVQAILARVPGTVGAINLMNRHRVLSMTAPYPIDRLGPDGVMSDELLNELGARYRIQSWTGFLTLYGTHRIVHAAQAEVKRALHGVANRVLFVTPAQSRSFAIYARRIPGALGRRLGTVAATLAASLELVNGQPNETAMPLAYWKSRNPATRSRPLDPSRDGCGLIWYSPLVPMRSASVRAYVSMIQSLLPKYGLEPLITLTSLNDRIFDSTVPLLFDRTKSKDIWSVNACYAEVLETGRSKGFFPYRIGIESMEGLMALQGQSRTFHGRLRASLDQCNILAPGRYS